MDEEKSLAYELIKEQGMTNKRQCVTIIILIIALALSNMGWLWVFQSYDYETTETITTVETTDGGNAYYTEKGDINNGESNQKNDKDKQNKGGQ